MATLLVLLVLGLIATGRSNPVKFHSCSNNQADDETRLHLSQVDISPWPIRRGASAVVAFGIDLKSRIDIGSQYQIEVKLRDFPLIKQKGDLCTLDPSLKCPHDPVQSSTLKYQFDMPKVPFSGNLDVQLQIWNQENDELCCVAFGLAILSDEGDVVIADDMQSIQQPINVITE